MVYTITSDMTAQLYNAQGEYAGELSANSHETLDTFSERVQDYITSNYTAS